MKLLAPFSIGSRLAPCVAIARGFSLSFVGGQFVFDLPDGNEYIVSDFSFPQGRIYGDTAESILQQGFASMLCFLSACAESRAYATRRGKAVSEGENSDLFPDNVGQLAEQYSDEIGLLACEIEETKGLLTAN